MWAAICSSVRTCSARSASNERGEVLLRRLRPSSSSAPLSPSKRSVIEHASPPVGSDDHARTRRWSDTTSLWPGEIKQRSSRCGKQPPPAIVNERASPYFIGIRALPTPPTEPQTAFASRRSPVRSRLAPSEEIPANQMVLRGWWYLVGTRVGRRVPQTGTTSGLILRGISDSAVCRQEVGGSIPVGWAKLLGAQTMRWWWHRLSGSADVDLRCVRWLRRRPPLRARMAPYSADARFRLPTSRREALSVVHELDDACLRVVGGAEQDSALQREGRVDVVWGKRRDKPAWRSEWKVRTSKV